MRVRTRLAVAAVPPLVLLSGAVALATGPGVPMGSGHFDYCLTDASASTLARGGIALRAVAPATEVSRAGRTCVRLPMERGSVSAELAGEVTTKGGFALERTGDASRAEFTGVAASVAPGSPGTVTAARGSGRTDVFSFTTDGVTVSPTRLHGTTDLTLTPDGARVLAGSFGAGAVPAAGENLFTADTEVGLGAL